MALRCNGRCALCCRAHTWLLIDDFRPMRSSTRSSQSVSPASCRITACRTNDHRRKRCPLGPKRLTGGVANQHRQASCRQTLHINGLYCSIRGEQIASGSWPLVQEANSRIYVPGQGRIDDQVRGSRVPPRIERMVRNHTNEEICSGLLD